MLASQLIGDAEIGELVRIQLDNGLTVWGILISEDGDNKIVGLLEPSSPQHPKPVHRRFMPKLPCLSLGRDWVLELVVDDPDAFAGNEAHNRQAGCVLLVGTSRFMKFDSPGYEDQVPIWANLSEKQFIRDVPHSPHIVPFRRWRIWADEDHLARRHGPVHERP